MTNLFYWKLCLGYISIREDYIEGYVKVTQL